MIIVIDNRTAKAYYSETKSEVAKLICVSPQTISNWAKCRNVEHFNRYTIYFDTTQLRSRRGYAVYLDRHK